MIPKMSLMLMFLTLILHTAVIKSHSMSDESVLDANQNNQNNSTLRVNNTSTEYENKTVTLPEHNLSSSMSTTNSTSAGSSSKAESRPRKVYYVDIERITGCSNTCNSSSYNGYGCFCGSGGSGAPVDAIDECCKEHEKCQSLAGSVCKTVWFQYLEPLNWMCTPTGPKCRSSPFDECSDKMCQCDLTFASCLSRYPCPNKNELGSTCIGNHGWKNIFISRS